MAILQPELLYRMPSQVLMQGWKKFNGMEFEVVVTLKILLPFTYPGPEGGNIGVDIVGLTGIPDEEAVTRGGTYSLNEKGDLNDVV